MTSSLGLEPPPPTETEEMPEHYTKNTLECTAWCNRCGKFTQHRVDGGRRGPCLDCIAQREVESEAEHLRQEKAEEERKEQERQNPRLFE